MDIFEKCYRPSLASEVKEKGIYPYFHALPPATPENECLLRTSYMATLTEPLLDEAMDIIAEVMKHE